MIRYHTLVACLAGALLFPALAAPAAAQVVEGEEHCVINVSNHRPAERPHSRARRQGGARKRYGDCGVS